MIDASIISGLKPIQIDTPGIVNMIQQGRTAALAQAAHVQQLQAGQQQMQSGALALKAQQQGITDDQTARAFFGQHPNATDEDILSALGPKVGNPIISERIKAQESKLKMAGEKFDLLGRIVAPINSEATFHAGIDAAAQAGVLPPADAAQAHQIGWTPEMQAHIQQIAAQGMKAKEQVDNQLAQLKEKREKAEADAKLPGYEADSKIKAAEAAAMNMSPMDAKQKVDAVIDPAKYPEQNRRALAMYTNALTLKDKNDALQKVSAEVGELQKETNPGLLQSRTDQAVRTQKALLPGEITKAVAEANAVIPAHVRGEVEKQIAIAKNSPDAFAGITDAFTRHAAETQYDKDSREYLGTVSESRRLKDLITAAQSGNKAAPGVIPTEELRGFVNRVNRQELERVSSGAGTGLDRISGFIKGYTEGQPIPAAILADTAKIADLNESAAKRKYNYNLEIVRQKGAKVQPINPDAVLGTSDAKLKAYADEYFGGDVAKAQAAIDQQRKGK